MNELALLGPKDVLEEIAATGLQLAKLVPWPTDLDGFQKITPVPKSEKKARAELMKKYGVDNLYDWCIENWGTKWDPGEQNCAIEESTRSMIQSKGKKRKIKEYEILVSFDTAWSPPVEAMKTVFDRYKDRGLTLWMEYFEPGCRFLGTVTTHDGKFEDQYREYKTADDLEDAVKELDHGLAESEVTSLREEEEEEAAEQEDAPEEPKAASVKTKPVKKAAPKKKPENISVMAKKVPLKSAKSAKPVKAKSPAKKAPAKVTVKRTVKKAV
jgi:hypothetical protein